MAGILDQFSLSGKRALVTGAGRGIGAALATALAGAGARVALVSRSENQLQETADAIGERAIVVPTDVSDTSGLPGLLDRIEQRLDGPIDIVVHAAGIQHREPTAEFARGAWDRVMAVNLAAPFFLSQEIGRRQLAGQIPGSHIFIASLGSTLGLPEVVAYNASKAGLLGVVRTMSREWSAAGIRANGLGPGYVQTELTQALFDDPVRRDGLLQRIPMGRFSTVSDLQGAAVFLASDASRYMTGQLLMVDGGWTSV